MMDPCSNCGAPLDNDHDVRKMFCSIWCAKDWEEENKVWERRIANANCDRRGAIAATKAKNGE